MSARWKNRPEGANWGDFGPDDQLGRLNLLTPERRLAAMREVRTGETFCLSLPLDLPGGSKLNPNRRPPERGVMERVNGFHAVNFPMENLEPHFCDVGCDDYVTIFTQYSTQWDGLAHVGQMFDADGDGTPEPVYYNGFRGHEHVVGLEDARGPAARSLGIEKMAETCVQGRGVLIDLHAHYGEDRKLVTFADLEKVMRADGVTVEEGDMLLLHTGMGQYILDAAGDPDEKVLHGGYAVLDGRDEALRQWITETGISVLVADNYAVEAFPSRPGEGDKWPALPIHELCLFKLGIHLGELWYLTELADWLREHGRSRFLLTAPPLRLPGSFGSPATPVATV
jgi:kynurenine formamidase